MSSAGYGSRGHWRCKHGLVMGARRVFDIGSGLAGMNSSCGGFGFQDSVCRSRESQSVNKARQGLRQNETEEYYTRPSRPKTGKREGENDGKDRRGQAGEEAINGLIKEKSGASLGRSDVGNAKRKERARLHRQIEVMRGCWMGGHMVRHNKGDDLICRR